MKRQHHTHADGTLTHIGIRILMDCQSRYLLSVGRGDIDDGAFLQLIAGLFHARISLHQLFDGDAVHFRDAVHGLFLRYLMRANRLSHRHIRVRDKQNEYQKIS